MRKWLPLLSLLFVAGLSAYSLYTFPRTKIGSLRAAETKASSADDDLKVLLQNMDRPLPNDINPGDRIGRILQRNKAAIPKVVAKLKDPNPYVRTSAALALGFIDSKDCEPFMNDLIAAFKDSDNRVRGNILTVWLKMGTSAAKAVPSLIAALNDKDVYIRNNVVIDLGTIGPAARSSLPNLKLAVKDSDCQVRLQAQWAIENITHPGAVSYYDNFKKIDKECNVPGDD